MILIIGKAGWIGTGPVPLLFDVGALIFVLRAIGNLRTFGFFKTITGTPFAEWDTWLYSPLCLLLALLQSAGLAPFSMEFDKTALASFHYGARQKTLESVPVEETTYDTEKSAD
jgi:hypothetical protein